MIMYYIQTIWNVANLLLLFIYAFCSLGSLFMSNKTGIIWNNEMCDFTLKRTNEEVDCDLVILLFL